MTAFGCWLLHQGLVTMEGNSRIPELVSGTLTLLVGLLTTIGFVGAFLMKIFGYHYLGTY